MQEIREIRRSERATKVSYERSELETWKYSCGEGARRGSANFQQEIMRDQIHPSPLESVKAERGVIHPVAAVLAVSVILRS